MLHLAGFLLILNYDARKHELQIPKLISLIKNTLFIINWNTIKRVSSASTHPVHV